jgi:hypothetical protein
MFDLDFITNLGLTSKLFLGVVAIIFLIHIIFYFITDYKDIIIKKDINCHSTGCLFIDTNDIKYYYYDNYLSLIMVLLGIKSIGLNSLCYNPGTKLNIKYNKYNNEIYIIKWYKDK